MNDKNIIGDIREAMHRWGRAIESGDPDKVSSLYDPEDGVLLGTLSASIRDTSPLIRDYFVNFLAEPYVRVTFHDARIRLLCDGTAALNAGYYTFTWYDSIEEKQIKKTLHARFSFVYKKTDQGWVIVDHHSSLIPGPS